MKIVAFDLGTSCGWAMADGRGPYVFGTLNLKPGRYAGGGMRFVIFGNELHEIFDGTPDLVVFEEVRRHMGVDAAHVYGGLLAVLTARCEEAKIPYIGVPVGTIKKHATGTGNAPKGQMINAALVLLADQGRPVAKLNSDEADAICLLDYAVKTFRRAKPREITDEEAARDDAADLRQREDSEGV